MIEIEKIFADYMLVNLLNQASFEHIFSVLCTGYGFSLTCQWANIAGSSYGLNLLLSTIVKRSAKHSFSIIV
jgi:hypothetical protein